MGHSRPKIPQSREPGGNLGGPRAEAAMACGGTEDRQKAWKFQHLRARKKGPGGTEESSPEVGGADIAVSVRQPGRLSTAKTAM